eukprot:c5654_g1_i1.p1 GENE.c5654_g1_i1~~c5654_g1_i1.p1  ORF type:complete len:325 (-),score=53.76 c5654_g1_i1:799-1773(-)
MVGRFITTILDVLWQLWQNLAEFVTHVVDVNWKMLIQRISGPNQYHNAAMIPLVQQGRNLRTFCTTPVFRNAENLALFASEWHLGFPPPFTSPPLERITLVLDLDETLVHSVPRAANRGPPQHYDFILEVEGVGQPGSPLSLTSNATSNTSSNLSLSSTSATTFEPCVYYVIKRPHVDFFLRMVSQWFHVVIFTASQKQYADAVIDLLDPHGYVSRRMFRDSCDKVEPQASERKGVYFVKSLERVCRDLRRVLIIDNSPVAYRNNNDNALPIKSFMLSNNTPDEVIDMRDDELLNMLPFLHSLCNVTDVRSLLALRNACLQTHK